MTKKEIFEKYKDHACSCAYFTSLREVMVRMYDEGIIPDLDRLSEITEGERKYRDLMNGCRKALGLPKDDRAWTDTFNFMDFTVKEGFLEGSTENVEKICDQFFFLKLSELNQATALKFEVSCIALMYAGAAKGTFERLQQMEKAEDGKKKGPGRWIRRLFGKSRKRKKEASV